MSVLDDKEETPLLPTASTARKAAESNAPKPPALAGIACVAASGFCFSLVTLCAKVLTFSMPAMEVVFWRSLSGFVFNYALIRIIGQNVHVESNQRRPLFRRCLAGFSAMSLGFYAISKMVMADANAIKFISPIMTFFFGACILHEKIDPVSLVCACLSFVGLICVVRPGFLFGYTHATAATDGTWMAVGAALLGALAQSMVFVTVRQLKSLDMLVVVHYFLLSGIISSLLFIMIVERHSFVMPATLTTWAVIVVCGVTTFLGQIFLTKGLQLEKAGVASAMSYLDVVYIFTWDTVLLHETINHWTMVGSLIICLGAVVIALRKTAVAH